MYKNPDNLVWILAVDIHSQISIVQPPKDIDPLFFQEDDIQENGFPIYVDRNIAPGLYSVTCSFTELEPSSYHGNLYSSYEFTPVAWEPLWAFQPIKLYER